MRWKCRDKELTTEDRTLVMGIINVTPDSFSDGGQVVSASSAASIAEQMVEDGADIIDIGGESTRPGAEPVSAQEEWHRIAPVLHSVRERAPAIVISVDTYKPEVARMALDAGVDVINDIYALRYSEEMVKVVSESGAGLVLMHMQGTPQTMQDNPRYNNVAVEVKDLLKRQMSYAIQNGISEEAIVADPGIGFFGKTLEHNLELLAGLEYMRLLQRPLLVGVSRKGFIGKLTGGLPETDREEGTIAACCVAVMNGASIIRVHNVKAARRAIAVVDAVRSRQ